MYCRVQRQSGGARDRLTNGRRRYELIRSGLTEQGPASSVPVPMGFQRWSGGISRYDDLAGKSSPYSALGAYPSLRICRLGNTADGRIVARQSRMALLALAVCAASCTALVIFPASYLL